MRQTDIKKKEEQNPPSIYSHNIKNNFFFHLNFWNEKLTTKFYLKVMT